MRHSSERCYTKRTSAQKHRAQSQADSIVVCNISLCTPLEKMATHIADAEERNAVKDGVGSFEEQEVTEDIEAQNFYKDPPGKHPHHHFSSRAPWLRAGVLGANDGEQHLELQAKMYRLSTV